MKIENAMRFALGLGVLIALAAACCTWSSSASGAALPAAPAVVAKVKPRGEAKRGPSAIALPAKPHPSDTPERARQCSWPYSVTLSPDTRWLAATSEDGVWVRDLRSSRWIRNLRRANPPVIRWHPTKPALIGTGGSADQPEFFIAYPSTGERRQLFRSDAAPFAWTQGGVVWHWGVIDLARSDVHGVTSYNLGYPVPWMYGDRAEIVYMASGPRDQVAAEVQPWESGTRVPGQRVETYRRVDGRRQWVRSGTIQPEVKDGTVVWYPRNPTWLGDGRLVYLRIYPAEWTHASTNGPRLNPKAGTARNRAELWVCDANGKGQRKITTLWDLRLYIEYRSADWITIDRAGRTLYYLSWDKIRVIRWQKPL